MNRRKKWKPRSNEIKVPPRSKSQILGFVQLLHKGFDLEKPICLETLLNLLANEEILEYEVVEDEFLGHNYAVTNRDYITIKQSVFDSVGNPNCTDHQRQRFTLAHEIGHAILHRDVTPPNLGFARNDPNPPLKPYEGSEWQADTFAGLLLVPYYVIDKYEGDVLAIAKHCNVSMQCAEIAVKKHGKYK